jgi:aspartate aminotransferase
MTRSFRERRDLVLDGLDEIGIDCPTPKGAFYAMPRVPEGFVDACIDRGVIVVPGEAFGSHGRGYARISYATGVEELTQALELMGEAYDAVR